jgi:glutaredoxin
MDTGYSLFPNIYLGKEHIGGYDDLKFYFSISRIKEKKLVENGFSTC